jgi:heptosyltransferase-2
VRSILVIRLDRIGDFVLCTPFLRELRRNAPQARIVLLVNSIAYSLARGCPYVDEVVAFDATQRSPYGRFWRAVVFARRTLARSTFDLCVLPRWGVDRTHATYIAFFSGSAHRVGYSEKRSELTRTWNRGYDRLLSEKVLAAIDQHEVEHNLHLLTHLGAEIECRDLELWWNAADSDIVERFWVANGLSRRGRVIVLAPFASERRKQWPLDGFRRIGRRLIEDDGMDVVIVGGEDEVVSGEKLAVELGPRCVNAAGLMTLAQTAALMRRCDLFLGNDSGPMHIAAAAGLPLVQVAWYRKEEVVPDLLYPDGFLPWQARYSIVYPPPPATLIEDSRQSDYPISRVSPEQVRAALRAQLDHLLSMKE